MKSNLTGTGRAILLATLLAAQAVSSQTSPTSWNVVEAGAKGDGQADGTPLFQRLLDEAGKAGGGVVEVPAGRFRINGHLTVPANVTLQGIFRVPPTTGPRAITNLTGSVLLAYEGRGAVEGPPFIRLAGRNAAIAGLIIAYPELRRRWCPAPRTRVRSVCRCSRSRCRRNARAPESSTPTRGNGQQRTR